MQMVAATKMRRAQNQALSGRPYNMTLNQAINQLLPRLETATHPLLNQNDSQDTAVLLISTDKSLCGALNTNLFRAAINYTKELKNISFYTLGSKGRQFVVRMGKELIADFPNSDHIDFRTASQIGKMATEAYLKGEIGQFIVIYPDFVSTLRQEPKVMKLLPVSIKDLVLEVGALENEPKKADKKAAANNIQAGEFLFEPDLDMLLDYVLNHFVQVKIYQAIMETKASEHSARMIAMKNATDNAKELVGDLTLAYNQTRQEGITKELLEITSALAALE
jgi:F-type H+-transporting ATPase subunit gamma